MQTPNTLLESVVSELTRIQGDLFISTWFRSARAVGLKDGELFISVPTSIERDTLKKRFSDNVSEILLDISGKELHPHYLTEEEAQNWVRENIDNAYANYTFDNFIVGPSNRFAHAAAMAVADSDVRVYNPLFIYGPSGVGKTHLLYAIAGFVRQRRPNSSVVYIKSEDMMNELIAAIKTGFDNFRAKYRRADLLLVDDVQFLTGKAQLQEEFFHTFNTLHESGKQIVLTADRPPKEMSGIAERLISRFESGLLADIDVPNLELRIALVEEKSRLLGCALPPKIAEYIASSITNNVRELEGAIRKINAMHSLMGRNIDLPTVQEAIRDLIRERPGLHPTASLILSEVSSFFTISEDAILSRDRAADVVNARQVACLLMKEMADMSLPAIGSFMNLHHTTVMYSIEKITKRIEESENFASTVADLRKNIESK